MKLNWMSAMAVVLTGSLTACVGAEPTVKPPVKPVASPEPANASPQKAGPSDVAQQKQNPFLTPGTCRTVYIVANSEDVIIAELKRQEVAYGRLGGRYGIYKRDDGLLMGADTMERYYENPKKYLDRYGGSSVANRNSRIKGRIARKARGKKDYFDETAYCSTGEEIVADTGKRYHNPTSTKGGGLFVKAVKGTVNLVREGVKNVDSGNAAQATSFKEVGRTGNSASQPATASGQATLKQIRRNGQIAGNPSYVIDCTWGSKTVLRKDNKWTDGTGHSYSDRTWSFSLDEFASRLCDRKL